MLGPARLTLICMQSGKTKMDYVCALSQRRTVQSMLILNRYNTLELEMLPQFKLSTINANRVFETAAVH